MNIDSTDRILISGIPGTGKTMLLKFFASQFNPDILIVDPLNQYDNFDDECRYIPRQETPIELEQICRRLWAKGNITLIIEEAEQYLVQGRAILPYTSGLIRMGRNWGVGIYATTRRIQDINKRFFDLAQHAFFFQCGLQSREYIAKMIGPEYVYPYPSPKYNHTGYTITTLPQFAFLHIDLKNEVAEVSRLNLGHREHIIEVGKKSEAPLSEKEPEEEGKNEISDKDTTAGKGKEEEKQD